MDLKKFEKFLIKKNNDITKNIKIGKRLYSFHSDLELSMTYLPIYNN